MARRQATATGKPCRVMRPRLPGRRQSLPGGDRPAIAAPPRRARRRPLGPPFAATSRAPGPSRATTGTRSVSNADLPPLVDASRAGPVPAARSVPDGASGQAPAAFQAVLAAALGAGGGTLPAGGQQPAEAAPPALPPPALAPGTLAAPAQPPAPRPVQADARPAVAPASTEPMPAPDAAEPGRAPPAPEDTTPDPTGDATTPAPPQPLALPMPATPPTRHADPAATPMLRAAEVKGIEAAGIEAAGIEAAASAKPRDRAAATATAPQGHPEQPRADGLAPDTTTARDTSGPAAPDAPAGAPPADLPPADTAAGRPAPPAAAATQPADAAARVEQPPGAVQPAPDRQAPAPPTAARAEAPAPAPQQPAGPAVSFAPTAGQQGFELRIEAPGLGAVEVEIRETRGEAEVLVRSDRADTLAALARDGSDLDRALRDAGIGPDGRSLAFLLGSEGGERDRRTPQGPRAAQAEPARAAAAGPRSLLDIQV
jgi:hypothetical protein